MLRNEDPNRVLHCFSISGLDVKVPSIDSGQTVTVTVRPFGARDSNLRLSHASADGWKTNRPVKPSRAESGPTSWAVPRITVHPRTNLNGPAHCSCDQCRI